MRVRLAAILAALLLLIMLAGMSGIWIGIPYLERRWSDFHPIKEGQDRPWNVPEGAQKVSLAAADGVRLSGWYFEGKTPRNGITILVLHGRYGALPGYVPDAQIGTIGRANCPVLVMHGSDDKVVPLTDAQEVYDAARPPKRLLIVPGTGHGFDDASRPIYLEEMASFIADPK